MTAPYSNQIPGHSVAEARALLREGYTGLERIRALGFGLSDTIEAQKIAAEIAAKVAAFDDPGDNTPTSNDMIADLRRLITNQPFAPFVIYMADGKTLRVPTVDHIAIAPVGARLVVFEDDGTANILSALLISRLAVDAQAAQSVA